MYLNFGEFLALEEDCCWQMECKLPSESLKNDLHERLAGVDKGEIEERLKRASKFKLRLKMQNFNKGLF